MPKIKQLSQHEAQKIAAGEVIERPANIVKELIENSIDAGATDISVYIEDAGKKLIRIVDNGCGMDELDARICFDRHATSKITHVDELETIDTFGFRGEALASIAAVSNITLTTKEENVQTGTCVTVSAGLITSVSSAACLTGTDIAIANLFFNVPARQKFLKSTETEWRAIQLLFTAFCFDYPHIRFALFHNDKQIAHYPPAESAQKRALQIWDTSLHNHLITIEKNDDPTCIIEGVISDHQQYRYDKNSIYFFVNKRWIKNYQLNNALIKGYANVIPEGRYPFAAINITVPLHEVDINIHPRKEEVKFLHPRRIEQALQQIVKAALEQNISKHLKKDVTLQPALQHTKPSYIPHERTFTPFNFDVFFTQQPFAQPINTAQQHATRPVEQVILPETQTPIMQTSSVNVIGQYNNTYLLLAKSDGLFLIDQHAAHERILYEQFADKLNKVATVQLLFPQTIHLTSHEMEIVLPHIDIFISHGILLEQTASNQLSVQSLPVHLKNESIDELIKEVIGFIVEYSTMEPQEFKNTIDHKLQAQMACKAAVKAGDELTHEKMQQLIYDLEKTANRLTCPHGRPTGWLLSLHDIEKKFKRKL